MVIIWLAYRRNACNRRLTMMTLRLVYRRAWYLIGLLKLKFSVPRSWDARMLLVRRCGRAARVNRRSVFIGVVRHGLLSVRFCWSLKWVYVLMIGLSALLTLASWTRLYCWPTLVLLKLPLLVTVHFVVIHRLIRMLLINNLHWLVIGILRHGSIARFCSYGCNVFWHGLNV